jgi:hypothetical protein
MTLRGEPQAARHERDPVARGPEQLVRHGAAQFAVSDAGDLVYAQGGIWPELPSDAGMGDPRRRSRGHRVGTRLLCGTTG